MTASSPFQVAVDARGGMLRATLRGFWDLQTTQAYAERLKAAAAELHQAATRPRWLIDLSALEVQAPQVAEHMTGLLQDLIASHKPMVAVVLSRALVGLQARRVADRGDHRFFPTIEEAQRWLAGDSV
jgi:hypothetical protein